MWYNYKTRGTCSTNIEFEVEGNIVKSVNFTGGCSGNLQGIAKLVEGLTIDEVKHKLKGITCGMKATSCPDQLTKALEQVSQ